jgi:ribose/xylose/arabinose/galactoside ABC-type transport system permease subunit
MVSLGINSYAQEVANGLVVLLAIWVEHAPDRASAGT